MPSLEIKRQVYAAAAAAEDKKAEDIRILALDPSESSLTDYFLICNGTNDRQNVAIGDEIEARMKSEFGMYANSIEGRRQGEWILMDYVDFVVHIFSPEKREYYGLERLRKSATLVSMNDLDAELNNRVKAARVAKPVSTGASDEVSATTPVPEVETHFASKASTPKSILSVAPAVAEKTPAKKKSVKAPAKKKAVAKKAAPAPAKKAVAKKPVKKAVGKKAAPKKAVKKAAVKNVAAKKVVKKVAAKKTVAKKVTAKKAAPKKIAAKKLVKKTAVKKTPAKKVITKKKAVAQKAPAKKAAKKKKK
jgi:ribosome-associated protein